MKKSILLATVCAFVLSPAFAQEPDVIPPAIEPPAAEMPAVMPDASLPADITTPVAAAPEVTAPVENRAENLRTVLLAALDVLRFELASQSVSPELQGDFIIEDKGTYLQVATPSIKINYSNGDVLNVGIINLNMAPAGRDGLWNVTMALPAAIEQVGEGTQAKARLDIGKQEFSGIWSQKDNLFTAIKAVYEGVQVSYPQIQSVISIAKLDIEKTSGGKTSFTSKPREIVGLGFSGLSFLLAVAPEIATKGNYTIKIDNGFWREPLQQVDFTGTVMLGDKNTLDMTASIINPRGIESSIEALASDPVASFRKQATDMASNIVKAVEAAGLKSVNVKVDDMGQLLVNGQPAGAPLAGTVPGMVNVDTPAPPVPMAPLGDMDALPPIPPPAQ